MCGRARDALWARGIEGGLYPTIEAKVAAVEAILEDLDADPERVRRLKHWRWIAETLQALPKDRAA